MLDFLLGLFSLITVVAYTANVLRLAKTLLSKCLHVDPYPPLSGLISSFFATAVSIFFVLCRVLGYSHCLNAYMRTIPLAENYIGNIDLEFATDEVLHGLLLLTLGYGLPWFSVFIRWLMEKYKSRKALAKLNAARDIPYRKKDFYAGQLAVIQQGFEDALTTDQAMQYADPKYSTEKMDIIRSSYFRNLTAEQIAVFANPAFSAPQMEEIRRGFEMGLSIEQVKAYADPAIDFRWMHVLYCNLMHQNEENKEKQNGTDSN